MKGCNLQVNEDNNARQNVMGDISHLMKRTIIVCALLLIIFGTSCILLYVGAIHINNPSKAKYPIRGVDVSHYQGEIDWKQLSSEDISFAYIKATEGSSNKDEQFDNNWSGAQATSLRIGAYHFFSLDSPGTTQANNFCNTVKAVDDMLPPVVDVEPYGKYKDNDLIDKEALLIELRNYIETIEAYYDMKPIIYTTEEWYTVIKDEFSDYDLWIRDVYGKPDKAINWTFWQFSNRHVLPGYSGVERYIDMNVFIGNEEDFLLYKDRMAESKEDLRQEIRHFQ